MSTQLSHRHWTSFSFECGLWQEKMKKNGKWRQAGKMRQIDCLMRKKANRTRNEAVEEHFGRFFFKPNWIS